MGSLNNQADEGGPIPAPAPAAPSPRAFRSATAWMRLLLVLAIGLGADLGSKWWAFENVAPEPVRDIRRKIMENPEWNVPHHKGVQALPMGLLDFQLVINHGAVFGIGANRRFFFIAFTIGALLAGLLVFGRFTSTRQWLAHLAIGLILAGGIGNLYDRIVFGVVRDFLHMLPEWTLPFGWNWPGGSPELFPWVFNLADVMLLAGMGLLILHMHRLEKRLKAPGAAVTNPQSEAAVAITPPPSSAPSRAE
jgi:signal peptidase II